MVVDNFYHKSVLLDETIDNLLNNPHGVYVDCTLGGGGHYLALAQKLAEDALVIGIDQDEDALAKVKERLPEVSCRTALIKGNFRCLPDILDELAINSIDGVVFDLGVSSWQLDKAERGFSYMQDGPLDMRMDSSGELTAEIVVNSYGEEKLAEIIWRYGEERWSKRIAEFIAKERTERRFTHTMQLVDTIKKAIPKAARQEGPHPAKRTFQAIRIEVNNELGILEKSLFNAAGCLRSGGKMAVITFHSLEDRIAKKTLTTLAKNCVCPPKLPICTCGHIATIRNIGSVKPTAKEVAENPRSRSARLRFGTKI